MRKKILVLCLSMLFVFGLVGLTYAAPKYVGAKKCKGCHKGPKKGKVYEIWHDSKHAKAFDLLKGDEQKNPECLGCHTTGYGKEANAKLKPGDLHGVQCEACHGPGSDYKKKKIMEDEAKAVAKGLIVPNEKTCVDSCHNKKSPNYKEFIFKERYEKIKHKIPPKK